MKIIVLLLCFISVAISTGCNTVSGIGEDMKRAGEKLQGYAE